MDSSPEPELPAPLPRIPRRSYAVPRPAVAIDLFLDGNEGPSPDADLLPSAGIDGEDLRRYPDARPLETELAARFGCSPAQCLVTAGADEGIDRFCRAFLEPGRSLVLASPGFEMVSRYVNLSGGSLVEVPWLTPELPAAELVAASREAVGVMLASPNNPTGIGTSTAVLCALAEACADRWVIVDLVYTEYADEDPTQALLAYPNVLVLRSFSKGPGLAGLRVGYALGPEGLIQTLRAAAGPFPVSGPSLRLARTILERPAHADAYIAQVQTARARLAELATELGAEVQPSQANFVLWRSARRDFTFAALAAQGIAVRRFPDRPGLEDGLRITCPGEPAQLERLCDALRQALRPEALLFDLDGVLADVSGSYRVAIQETVAAFGGQVSGADIAAAKAGGDANNDWILSQRLLAQQGIDVPLAEVTARFEALYQGTDGDGLWRRETLLLPAARLRELAGRFPMALVTGRPRADAQRFLAHFDIADCFQTLVCMEDGPAKPAPDPVQRAMTALSCRHAWMIGDTVDDLRAARAAGVLGIAVRAPGAGETEVQSLRDAGPAALLDHSEELPGLLP